MRTFMALGVGVFVLLGSLRAEPPAEEEEGLGERIGEQLDIGVEKLGRQLRKGWAEIRQSVDELGLQGRVYGRLRWDKAIRDAPLDVQIEKPNVVVLSGTVADEAARRKAVTLAEDTVGVREVIDRLAIAPPPSDSPADSTSANETPASPSIPR